MLHCKCLQGITGCLQVFPAISMKQGCKNHRETLYSSEGKIVYVVWKPCNIYRLRGNPIIIMGFPTICKYYRVSQQHTQSFPLRRIGFLCDSYSFFSIDGAGKTCRHSVMPCKHLQCTHTLLLQGDVYFLHAW
jgi:hypothetical protein